jgi:hypothetical protein
MGKVTGLLPEPTKAQKIQNKPDHLNCKAFKSSTQLS